MLLRPVVSMTHRPGADHVDEYATVSRNPLLQVCQAYVWFPLLSAPVLHQRHRREPEYLPLTGEASVAVGVKEDQIVVPGGYTTHPEYEQLRSSLRIHFLSHH